MTDFLTERNRYILSGAIGLLVLFSLITLGIKASFGAYDGGYELRGTFASAGQGLISGSDVKVRGVNVGEVRSIELVEGRALIKLRINDGVEVPTAAEAVIRPKTLFGEKFVDLIPGDTELSGPYLDDGGEIASTLGGFELEQVLSDAYPVLDAIDPIELATVVSELAKGADGLGENVNRSIVNGAELARLSASNDAEFRQFTSDLALLSEELDRLSPDLVTAAKNLNSALPVINARGAELNEVLVQAGRIAGDVADVLEANASFTKNALTNGSRQIQVLYDGRGQLQPLLLGITQYTQFIAEVIRIEVGDGTLMAAVKSLTDSPLAGTTSGSRSTASVDVDVLDGLLAPLTPDLESAPSKPSATGLVNLLVGERQS